MPTGFCKPLNSLLCRTQIAMELMSSTPCLMLFCSMSSKNSWALTGGAKRYGRSACDNASAYHLSTTVGNCASKFLSAEIIGTVGVSVVDIDDKDGEDALNEARYHGQTYVGCLFQTSLWRQALWRKCGILGANSEIILIESANEKRYVRSDLAR